MQSYLGFFVLLIIENSDYNPYIHILCNGRFWESTSYGDRTKHTPGDTTRRQAFRVETADGVVGKGVERPTTFYERTNVIYFCFVIYYESRGKKILSAARESNTVKWAGGGDFGEIYEAYDCGERRQTNEHLAVWTTKDLPRTNVNAIKVVTHVERNRTSRTIYIWSNPQPTLSSRFIYAVIPLIYFYFVVTVYRRLLPGLKKRSFFPPVVIMRAEATGFR